MSYFRLASLGKVHWLDMGPVPGYENNLSLCMLSQVLGFYILSITDRKLSFNDPYGSSSFYTEYRSSY